jgi:transposase
MLVDKASKLPIFFRAIPGEIADVSTLKATFKEIELLGLKVEHAIFDAGYFSETNINYLCKSQISFISRMPKSRKVFTELVDNHKTNLEDIANTVQYGDRVVFIKSVEISLYGYQMFAHIILDPDKKAKDMKYLMIDSLNNPNDPNSG